MNFRLRAAGAAVLAFSIAACSGEEARAPTDAAAQKEQPEAAAAAPSDSDADDRTDKFTYANYAEVRISHVALDFDVLFEEKVLDGTATLDLEYVDDGARRLILDTDDLLIKSVEARAGDVWTPAIINLGPDDPVMGSRLEIALPDGAEQVRIAYRTSPEAAGLQWLSPEQTAGKQHPFVYSQNQAINARSMVPLQDTPAVRFTYTATVRTPKELFAVMSAAQDADGVRDGDYYFEMPQPIPSYLIAIAVGDIDFQPISEKIGVYSEDYILSDAAREFEDAPRMVEANESLYGPYRWDRYDMLVLPPSFPIGGMENPRLTFLTPTVIAGDKSLTNVVAHELAHSWSGNLVTNATWRDIWLNEGVTSYVENRVIEALYGEERAVMERALDLENLKRDIAEATRPEFTQLKLPADIKDTEEAFSQVAYVKGAFFLKFLENRYGRAAFDAFLKSYFDHFAFKPTTTEDFLAYLKENLATDQPDAVTAAELHLWLYEPGLPETAEAPASDAFEKISATQAAWLAGNLPVSDIDTAAWTTHEWLHFLNSLPGEIAVDRLAALDAAFQLSKSRNAEIAYAWFMKAIKAGYEPAFPEIRAFLMRVGRGKFIFRLYGALAESGRKIWALDVYNAARAGYHPISQKRIDEILK
jgi:aminopeptidase N